MHLTRRSALAAAAGATAALALHNSFSGGNPTATPARAGPRGPVPFGSAAQLHLLKQDRRYHDAIVSNCQQVVPEGLLKWDNLRPTRQEFTFEHADNLLTFAAQKGIAMRGHTLVWYAAMPKWADEISSAAEAERLLVEHIEKVVSHYKGRILSWDVVNEAISDEVKHARDLRPCIWLKHLGPRYIDIAFRTAAAVDPTIQLVLNEFNIEASSAYAGKKRQALLTLVRDLKDRGVPIGAIGLQGHLHGETQIDRQAVSTMVSEFKRASLDILVTELDVIDNQLPAAVADRDSIVAARAADFLSAVFDAATPTAVLTWGITDRYTWVPMYYKRSDGSPNRPLPLDAEYRPKPLMDVIKRYCARVD